ncbi:MAG TPA: hypothetical protein VIG24_12345 [Acidimicrobiia bacterium]
MATVSEIRTALATKMADVYGLRTSAHVPDNPRPPMAVVMPERIIYDTNANRGLDSLTFTITVLVGRADDRAAQQNLDKYLLGDDSVKGAIEADRTLGGKVQSCRVTEMNAYQQVPVGETLMLGAQLTVEVWA